MNNRLSQLHPLFSDHDVSALLLTQIPDIRWACGFTGSNGILIARPDGNDVEAAFVTDGRYDEQARHEVSGAEVYVYRGKKWDHVEEKGLLEGLNVVGFQSDHLTVSQQSSLAERFSSVEWAPVSNLLTRKRGTKDSGEIERITKAQRITEAVFEHVVEQIRPGRSEREIAAELVYEHLKRGAEKMSFDPIVASGPNAAKPHARPTDRMIQPGDVVVIDVGCFADGYASDMTRTVAVGEPGDEVRRGYDAVLRAQKAALNTARAGLTGEELDAAAREVLADAELEDFFSHSLGHGVGLEIHEWPRVSHTTEYELPAGACVTIEPGVYVPEEEYGVRIEDLIVLTEDGCDNLTRTPKALRVIDA